MTLNLCPTQTAAKSTTTVLNRDETCANTYIVFTNVVSHVG